MPAPTKPAFGFINYLADRSNVLITSSMAEIVYPTDRLFDLHKCKVIRSAYQSYKIDSKNNKLDFNTGSNFTATIPTGQFRPEELEGLIATAMNTAAGTTDIECEYDFSTLTFTISKEAGTLQLKCATGTNKRTSIFASIGYDCSSDKTGSLSYTASNATKSTFGRFVITTANQKLYFKHTGGSARTATIAPAEYSAGSLCSEIKYHLDNQDSRTDYDVRFDYSILKFIIKLAGTTFELTLSSNTNPIWDTLGWTDGGGSDLTGLSTATADEIRIHTSEYIQWFLSTAQEIDYISLFGFNWSEDGTYTWDQNNSASWPNSAATLTHDPAGIVEYFTSPSAYSYYYLEIEDRTNSDGFVEVGIASGGPLVELSEDVVWEANLTRKWFTERGTTAAGVTFGSIKGELKGFKFSLPDVDENDFDILEALGTECQDVKPFFFYWNSRIFWMLLENPLDFTIRPVTNEITHELPLIVFESK